MSGTEALQHYGVKGMKWGVRRDGSVSSATATKGIRKRKATDVTVTQKSGQFVKTKGGKNQNASDDAVRVAASRQLAKRSTTDSLSNKQLQDAVTRMNLEQQYSVLVKKADRRNRGRKMVSALLNIAGDKNVSEVSGTASKIVGEALKKK